MDNQQQNPTEEYVMPTEQNSGGIELPTNPNKWLFVMVVGGISTIFSILMVLQNNRLKDEKEESDQWKKLYFAEKQSKDSVILKSKSSEDALDQVYRLKKALYKIDSVTSSGSPKDKISKRKLNDEIKTAVTKE